MKKLLYILLLSTLTFSFTACGSDDDDDNRPPMEFDDWNDDRSPNYKPEGYNPIEGEWVYISTPTTKVIYTDSFKEQIAYKNNDGSWELNRTLWTYIINDKKYKSSDGKIFEYTISQEGNREILTTIIGSETTRFYRLK